MILVLHRFFVMWCWFCCGNDTFMFSLYRNISYRIHVLPRGYGLRFLTTCHFIDVCKIGFLGGKWKSIPSQFWNIGVMCNYELKETPYIYIKNTKYIYKRYCGGFNGKKSPRLSFIFIKYISGDNDIAMQEAGLWPSIDIVMQRFDIWASIDIAMQGAGVQTFNLNLYWHSYARGPGMSHYWYSLFYATSQGLNGHTIIIFDFEYCRLDPAKHHAVLNTSLMAMMASSNGNIFRVTGPLCGEFTGHSSHKGQWRGTLVFSLICTWTNGRVTNRYAC